MHSIPKLALTVIASPLTAFKEIVERRLLVQAIWIVGIAGTLAMFSAIARAFALGPEQLLVLGRDNPLTWIGLSMMYGLLAWTLLRWLGAEIDYPTVLTVIGWSQAILIIHQALGLVWGILIASGSIHDYEGYAVRFFSAAGTVLPIMYVLAIGRGLQATGRVSFAKAILVYIIVVVVVIFGLEFFYTLQLMAPFAALPYISRAVNGFSPALVSLYGDPWQHGLAQFVRVILGGLGLTLGIWTLAKFEIWDSPRRNRLLSVTAAVAVIGIITYGYAWNHSTYYPSLVAIQRLYSRGNYADAADRIDRLIPRLGNTPLLVWGIPNKALLLSAAAEIYYLADKPDQSIRQNVQLIRLAQDYAPDKESKDDIMAHAYSTMGMAHDIQGNYSQALAFFDKVIKIYPNYPEPWVRMAVTYDRMGNYKKAIDSGNHAIKQLDSNAPVAWVALAQAFINTGDKTQAGAAISMVAGLDPALASRFGDKPEGWKNAVSKLTVQDLRFPLEREPKQAK